MKEKKTDKEEMRITIPLDSAMNYINERAKIDINTTKTINIDLNPLRLPKGVNLKKYYYSYCEKDAFPKWKLNMLFVPVTPENHLDMPKEEFTLDGYLVMNLGGGILFYAIREKIMEFKNMARKQYEESAKATSKLVKVETSEGIVAENILEEQTKAGFAYAGEPEK